MAVALAVINLAVYVLDRIAFTHCLRKYRPKHPEFILGDRLQKQPRTIKKILGFIPGPRPSTAYGYAQALETTWEMYEKNTGRRGGQRDDFDDVIDFVGWYCDRSYKRCSISKKDAYNLYLAHHEGHGGFNKRTYRDKKWLQEAARKVRDRARTYSRQLNGCLGKLEERKERKLFLLF